jgi:ribosome-associated translation inhibitor RaiA
MTPEPSIQVAVLRGEIPETTIEYAREKVGSLLRLAPAPVLFARMTLAHEDAPGLERPAVAKATLDVNGRPVRAHVAASTDDEAVDLLEERLRHGLETLTEKRQGRRHEPAETVPGSWRRGSLPTYRPEWFPRPVEDRELVRHKPYLLREQTVAEAALDLVILDQDWVLFTELTTGADALLERVDSGYHLTIDTDDAPDVSDLDEPVTISLDVPRMDLPTALRLLDETDDPFVFLVDADTGRGRVVYHRYDGHYGTITGEIEPPTEPARSPS